MKQYYIVLAFVMVSTTMLAKQIDNSGRGESVIAKRANKSLSRVTQGHQNILISPANNFIAKTAMNNRIGDISEISSFPFQEPYTTGRSYSESCPFTLANGNLFVVYASPFNDSLFSVTSSDSGSNWTTPTFVRASVYFDFLSGTRTSTGRLIIVWCYSGLSMCYSDNEGSTWSNINLITNNPGDFLPNLSQTLDGTLWLTYCRYNSSTKDDIYYRKSTNNGVTWSDEQTFVATSDYDFFATIVSRDTSTIIAVYIDRPLISSGINSYLCLKTSTDGGGTWSAPSIIENDTTFLFYSHVLRQSDGTLWLVYENDRSSKSGFIQSDIAYRKSSDGGNTWSSVSYMTNYAGNDSRPNACLRNNQLFVTFESDRWCILPSQTHLWYGIAGTSIDKNPPPALISYSHSALVGDSISFRAYVDDETGIASVQLYYSLNGIPHGPLPMYDDGTHNDYIAGDNIFGVTVSHLQLGDQFNYSITISDVNSNTVQRFLPNIEIPAIHNAGNIVLRFKSNSELADYLNESSGAGAYWPKAGGYDYLYDGGLWIGCNVNSQNLIVQQYYGMSGWQRTTGTPFTLGPGISDQDGDVTYDDHQTISQIGLQVHQQSYQWSDSTRDDFIVFKYTITNRGTNGTLNNISVGLWTDPDVASETDPQSNSVGYDSKRHLVYAYNTLGNPTGYFGVKLIGSKTIPSSVYAWRANQINEGTDSIDYQCLTKGGTTLPDTVGDVRMLIAAPTFSINQNASQVVTFGIVMGNGLSELQKHADTMEAICERKIVTSVNEPLSADVIPLKYDLNQNYPNPFNPSTTISFDISLRSFVSLKVYDVLGREVATLVHEELTPGHYSKVWKSLSLSSGIYLYTLRAGNYVETKKLVILK